MTYTIRQLADLVGISTRTLRYYDQINLLKPAQLSKANYRQYGSAEVTRLREILTYRALDFSLSDIQQLLSKPTQRREIDLQQQLSKLEQQQRQLKATILAVQQQILLNKGALEMTDSEKFTALKQAQIKQNEAQFGDEIRTNYGDATIDESNQKLLGLSAEQFAAMKTIEKQLIVLLQTTVINYEVTEQQGQEIYRLHKDWLNFTWPNYSAEAHRGLAAMYLADERFTTYYDTRAGQGATQVLHDSIVKFAK